MGLIGRKIVQTRTYVDPNNPPPPLLNYEESFPITVFDAVRESMDDVNSKKLSDIIEEIKLEMRGKQQIFPAKSANYLMSYAGVEGGIGAVQMSYNVPWDPNEQSHDKIPTEKAVGNLMFKLGLVDENGNIISPDRAKVRYSDIIGRPLMYEGLGDNTDGFITQKGINEIINNLKTAIDDSLNEITSRLTGLNTHLFDHTQNMNNPHNVSIDQIGAASAAVLTDHMLDMNNPHHVTPEQVGLGNVDNTSDKDKPISDATQEALDALKELLNVLQNDANGFITNIEYDQPSGVFKATFNNKSFIKFLIPINGLIDEIKYNKETKEVDIYELGGEIKHMSLSDLFIRYLGSVSSTISVSIIGNNETGEQIIHASIMPQSVTDEEMADSSVITRVLSDQAVTTDKIHDLSVTTDKLGDKSVVTEKIQLKAVTNTRLDDRAVDGRVLFTSKASNRVLVVGDQGTDPYFGRINPDMMDDESVTNRALARDSVSADKLQDYSVITTKLDDESVVTDKLGNKSVTNKKIADRSVDTRTIQPNVKLPGTPSIAARPDSESNNNEITDTRWVTEHVYNYINENHNYGDRSVDGRALFSSDIRHRVLATLRANSDPVWSQVDGEMIANDTIARDHIKDKAINGAKIAFRAVNTEHLEDESVTGNKIADGNVTSIKMFVSENANMVLAAVKENGHPVYSKIIGEMMSSNAIDTSHIKDQSVTLSKIKTSEEANRLLGVHLPGSNPEWLQATTGMIADSAVTLDKIHEVPFRDMVLGSQSANTHPEWTKVNGNMILDNAIRHNHIGKAEVDGNHIKERVIESKHILQYNILTEHIAPGAVTGSELFTSKYPNRVLAVTDPFSKAEWLEIDTDMLRDEAITKEKLFRSENAYRVLGTTRANVPPEYVKITNDFIVDDTIRPQKLVKDFVLYGVPEMTGNPSPDSNGYEIPNTRWVKDAINEVINDMKPTHVTEDMIVDHAVGPTKIFRSIYDGPRLLGVTDKNEDPEYLLVENRMIADAAVTTNKIQRDVHLLGSPALEVRPSPAASESSGEGSLIPDVQWVLDRINERADGFSSGSSNSGSSSEVSAVVEDNSVTTNKIQNRAVTGAKLFTSSIANKVLAVIGSNTDPKYVSITNPLIDNRVIDGRTLFSASADNMVLATIKSNDDPSWTKITLPMMAANSVGSDQIIAESITGDKIANNSIGREKFVGSAFVDETLLYDLSVSNSKLQDGSVSRSKIANSAIDSTKLDKDLQLKGSPTVESNTNYEKRSIRNIILSPNAPSGGQPGDIWIRYI